MPSEFEGLSYYLLKYSRLESTAAEVKEHLMQNDQALDLGTWEDPKWYTVAIYTYYIYIHMCWSVFSGKH